MWLVPVSYTHLDVYKRQVWNTSNKNVSKSSKKNKWKLTDSLKEKIVDLAKKDAQDNVCLLYTSRCV